MKALQISRALFTQWVRGRPDSWYASDTCDDCPIAQYLAHIWSSQNGYREDRTITVSRSVVTVFIFIGDVEVITGEYKVPLWAREFIRNYDSEPSNINYQEYWQGTYMCIERDKVLNVLRKLAQWQI